MWAMLRVPAALLYVTVGVPLWSIMTTLPLGGGPVGVQLLAVDHNPLELLFQL
jgi:hypothetical protein